MSNDKSSELLQVIRNQIAALSFEELRLIKTIRNIRQQRNYLIEVLDNHDPKPNLIKDDDEDFQKIIEFPNDQVKN
jgi:hypothetical protein|tara:strand:- start:552 stop:779 length:228 start_codon:yes stop_codon:yes gene_type:complete